MRWHKVSLLALTFHPLGCWPLLLWANYGWWHSKKLVAYPRSYPGRGGGAGGEQQPCFLVWVYLSITAIKEHRSFPSPADFLQCGTQALMMDIYGTLHPKLQRKHSFKCTWNIRHGVSHAELFRMAALTLKEPNSSTVSSAFCENTYEITSKTYTGHPERIHLGRNLIGLRCLGRLIRHTTALACEAISRDHWFRWEVQSWTEGAPSHAGSPDGTQREKSVISGVTFLVPGHHGESNFSL